MAQLKYWNGSTWVTAVVGSQGYQGVQGADGAQGPQGFQGYQGNQGVISTSNGVPPTDTTVLWYDATATSTIGVANATPGGVVYGAQDGTGLTTAPGTAGAFLMSYGDVSNGGPEFVQLNVHEPVAIATTGTNIPAAYVVGNSATMTGDNSEDTPFYADTLTINATGPLYIDGVLINADDRVLFKDQTDATQNGIWLCLTAGSAGVRAYFSRDNDSDTIEKLAAATVAVYGGALNGGSTWTTTLSKSGTFGVTGIYFTLAITSATGVGTAGELLMSYGGTGQAGPNWVAFGIHEPVKVATTGTNIAGTYTVGANTSLDPAQASDVFLVTATGILTIDNYAVGAGDRILIKDQLNAAQNGIWLCTTAGSSGIKAAFVRDNDANNCAKLAASIVQVSQGTTNGGSAWICSTESTSSMGTTPINFSYMTASSGGYGQPGQLLMSSGNPGSFGNPKYIQYNVHQPVQVATTGSNIAGTYSNNTPGSISNDSSFVVSATGAFVVDGYTVLIGDRILLKDQTNSFQNGVYLCTVQGVYGINATFVRDVDIDTTSKLAASVIQVLQGTQNGGTVWFCSSKSTDTMGTTAVNFSKPLTSSTTGTSSQLLASGGPSSAAGFYQFGSHPVIQVASTGTNIVGTYAVGANTTNDIGTASDTFTVTATGAFVLDGYTVGLGDRILLKDQTAGLQNGVYKCTTYGTTGVSAVFVRDFDANTIGKLAAGNFSILQGSSYGGTTWYCTNKATDTIGTTAITFSNPIFATNTPTANQVLAANASGVATWQSAPAVSTISTNTVFTAPLEAIRYSTSAIASSQSIYASLGSVWFYNAAATANWTLNITGSSTPTTLNSILGVNQSITIAVMVLQGGTAWYNSAIQIDGNAITTTAGTYGIVYWSGGSAPTSGNANQIDVYNYTIIKTASNFYTVLAAQTKF